MAARRNVRRSGSWLPVLAGFSALAVFGFGIGFVTGGLLEAPDLVLGHVLGETEEIAWSVRPAAEPPETAASAVARVPADASRPSPDRSAAARTDPTPPDVAAAPPLPPMPTVAAAPAVPPMPAVAAVPPVFGQDAAGVAPDGFAVQVGAFSDGGAAERLAGDLRRKGYPVYLAAGAGEGESRWRVRVGPLASRAEADLTAGRLKSDEKLPTWVLSEAVGAP